MPSLSKEERNVKSNTDDLILRKKLNLSSSFDIGYISAESLTNKCKLFWTKSKRTINFSAPSKKYIMIEEFKDERRDLKKYIEWDKKKKTGTIERTKNK